MKLTCSSTLPLAVAIPKAQTWATTAMRHNIRHSGHTASTPAAKTIAAKSKQAIKGVYAPMKSMQEMHNIWSFQ